MKRFSKNFEGAILLGLGLATHPYARGMSHRYGARRLAACPFGWWLMARGGLS
jgi:hypothetical protein